MFRFQTGRVRCSRPIVALLLGLLVSGIGVAEVRAAEPARSSSRLIPARGLTAYVEYDGLGPHADAWKATAAHEILIGTPIGAMIEDMVREVLTPDPKMARGKVVTGADFVALGEYVLQHGLALAWYDEDGASSMFIVVNGLGGKECRDRFDRVVRFALSTKERLSEPPTPNKFRRRDIYHLQDRDDAGNQVGNDATAPRTWWFEGDDLIVVPGSTDDLLAELMPFAGPEKETAASHRNLVAMVLDTIEGKQPNVSTRGGYVAASAEGRDLGGFEPNGLFFVESRNRLGKGVLSDVRDRFESLPGMTKGEHNEFDFFDVMDVSRARRIVARWGFRGKSLLTDLRFEAPAPWGGLVGLLDPKGFRKDRLPPIPRDTGALAVAAFVRGDLRTAGASLDASLKDEYREGIKALEEAIRNGTSPQLREDLLRHLGPTGCVFAAPDGGKDTADSTVASFLIGMDDAEAVGKALDFLASQINTYFRDIKGGEGRGGAGEPGGGRPAIALERLPAPDRGYRLISPAGLIPWLTADVQPTVLVGKSFVALANNPALARAALVGESRPADRWAPSGELVKMLDSLPANLAFLSIGNPRDSFWPETIAKLPETVAPYMAMFKGTDAAGGAPAARSFKIPKAGELRALLVPSVLATVVDDRSLRFISLEALPIGCLRGEFKDEFMPGERKIMINPKFAPRR